MVVLTGLGRMVSLFGICFMIIGYVHGSPLMYMVALCCFAALGVAAVFAALSLRNIRIERELSANTAFSGDPLTGKIRFLESRRRWRMFEVYDQHTNLISGLTTRRRMLLMTERGMSPNSLVAGARQPVQQDEKHQRITEVQDVVRFARRGHYHMGPLLIHGHDPFGLCYLARQVPAEHEIIVYPHPLPVPELMMKGARGRQNTEVRPVGHAGESAEFHGIRPYVQGDDLRRVHWKASAHTGKLAIKEFEYRYSGAVQVVLDLQQGIHAGERDHSTLETSITLAASMLNHVITSGNQVGLFATSSTPVSLPQESGRRQLHRALEALALAKADGVVSLAQALTSDESHTSRRSSAIVITPSTDLSVIGPLLTLRGRSARVLLVLLDPRSFLDAEQEQSRPRNALASLASIPIDLKGLKNMVVPKSGQPTTEAHQRLLHAAAAAGIDVFPISASVPLHQALQGIRMRMY